MGAREKRGDVAGRAHASTQKDRDRFHPRGERGLIKPFDFDEKRYVFISYPRTTDPDLLRAIVRSLLRRGVGGVDV